MPDSVVIDPVENRGEVGGGALLGRPEGGQVYLGCQVEGGQVYLGRPKGGQV